MMGFFYKDISMKEDRIKILEQEVAYLWKAVEELVRLTEQLKPEVHTHYHLEVKNCKIDDKFSSDNQDSIEPFNM